jgi:predicted transcriptional regulator
MNLQVKSSKISDYQRAEKYREIASLASLTSIRHGEAHAYEIAKALNWSRGKTSKALKRLLGKKRVRRTRTETINGRERKYYAAAVPEMTRVIREHSEAADGLCEPFNTGGCGAYGFIVMQDDKTIREGRGSWRDSPEQKLSGYHGGRTGTRIGSAEKRMSTTAG